jgi:hypothetical protein
MNWSEIIKKETRAIGSYELGEVQLVEQDYVVTEKGIVDKDTGKNLIERYDEKTSDLEWSSKRHCNSDAIISLQYFHIR